MTLTVHLPEELARRVAEVAAARRVDPEQVALEAIAAQLPAEGHDDPLEAFIASGRSGRGDLGRRHRQINIEITGGLSAREL